MLFLDVTEEFKLNFYQDLVVYFGHSKFQPSKTMLDKNNKIELLLF